MFADLLKNLRLSRGLTQTELARILGISLRTLQNYELGKVIPRDPKILNRMSAYFHVPVRQLLKSDDYYHLLRTEAETQLEEQDRADLYRIIQELTTLFAGGSLSRSDRELFAQAVTELLHETRQSGDE